MEELRTCVEFQSDSTIKREKSYVILGEQETLSAINDQVQTPCISSEKTEPSSVGDLQENLNDNIMLKTESPFCSYTDKTYCSQISFVQLENSSSQTYIKLEPAVHIHQSNWRYEDAVKLEYSSQDAICCIKTEQVPGQEVHHIKPEHAVRIEQSDCKHESTVKLEYHSQDVNCSIKTEQDPVNRAKTEEQLVKSETDQPGQHDMWQCESGEKFQEINAHMCKTPEVTNITEIQQHQMLSTATKVTIDSETSINRNAKPYQCQVCLSSFSFPALLKKHMMIHSDFKADQSTADIVVLERLDTSKQHKVINSNKRSHQCDLCKLQFRFLYKLKQHKLTHSGMRSHQCNVCKAAFKRSGHLRKHMLTHSDVRSHQCHVCKAAFKSSSHLRRHMLTHSDVKPHQCSLCGAMFKWSSGLGAHMVSHSDERPHKCTECHLGYKRLGDLKQHMVTHSDVRPHQCSLCAASFKRLCGLKKHMLTHSDEKPHQCTK